MIIDYYPEVKDQPVIVIVQIDQQKMIDTQKRIQLPDYLVIDNFTEYFRIEEEELLGARNESEKLTKAGCEAANEAANEDERKGSRCDTLMWL